MGAGFLAMSAAKETVQMSHSEVLVFLLVFT
jgi:hypothetical protein